MFYRLDYTEGAITGTSWIANLGAIRPDWTTPKETPVLFTTRSSSMRQWKSDYYPSYELSHEWHRFGEPAPEAARQMVKVLFTKFMESYFS